MTTQDISIRTVDPATRGAGELLRRAGSATVRWLRKRGLHILAALALTALILVAVRLIILLFTFDYKDPNHGVTVMAAGVALIGVLFTGVVTLVGVSLKQWIDQRNLQLAQRAADDRVAEQQRLRMDTAIQVVRALSLDDGRTASPAQCSGAVLVLSGLGQTPLSLNLVADLWPQECISASAAVSVIDDALALGDVHVTRHALTVLLTNVTRLDIDDDLYEWPVRLEKLLWDLDRECLGTIRTILVRWLKHSQWDAEDDFRPDLLSKVQSRLKDVDQRDSSA